MKRRTTNNDTIAPVHLKYIYESEPDLRLGVSIGAFTAAIVASHPDNPIDHLESFLTDLTVFHSKLLPAQVEKIFCLFWYAFLDRVGSPGGQCLKSRRESGYHVPRNDFQARRGLESRSQRKNKCRPHCSSSKKALGAVEAVCSSSQSATRKNFQFMRGALRALASTIALSAKSRSAMRYPANIRA
jgi:hypothetical protein